MYPATAFVQYFNSLNRITHPPLLTQTLRNAGLWIGTESDAFPLVRDVAVCSIFIVSYHNDLDAFYVKPFRALDLTMVVIYQ